MTERDDDAGLDEALREALGEVDEDSTVQTDEGSEAVEAEAVDNEEPEDSGEEYEIPEELQPVSAWNEEARSAWESFLGNAENHESLRPIAEQFRSDYAYRTQIEQERAQLREQAQYANQLQQTFSQYGDVLQGRNPADVVGNLLYYSQKLQKDPQNTILDLAKQYGVNLEKTLQDQPYIDDATRQLMERIERQEQFINQQQELARQAQVRHLVDSAKAFESETDAEGNPAHPYATSNPAVQQEMIRLYNAGMANSWHEAYDRACWSIPEVRAELMKQQEGGRKQQQQEQAKKAKAAATAQPKRGKSSKSQPAGVEGLDDAIEKAARELGV